MQISAGIVQGAGTLRLSVACDVGPFVVSITPRRPKGGALRPLIAVSAPCDEA